MNMVSLLLSLCICVAFWTTSIHSASTPGLDYAYPRFLILGPTGVGKSSLANVLSGCPPNDNNCFSPVCAAINPCTNNTAIKEANFLGSSPESDAFVKSGRSTIIDTPGFGNKDGETTALLSEMDHNLEDDLKRANIIVLCFEGDRWDAIMVQIIHKLEATFGQKIWENVIIEVTKWAYDAKSIQDRERRGITEENVLLAINNELRKNFQLDHILPGIFLDSFAVYYPDDDVQTRFFRKYSSILWEAAVQRRPVSFSSIQVQDRKTSACGIGIDCCETLTNEINDIKEKNVHFDQRLNNNTFNILDNKFKIGANKKHIEDNSHDIETNKETIQTLTDMIEALTDKMDIIKNKIDTNTHDISTNRETIETLTETTSHQVSFCGYTYAVASFGKITYQKLATNVNSFGSGGLDIGTGVFTSPTRGTFLVNAHFISFNAMTFAAYITLNGQYLEEGLVSGVSAVDDSDSIGRSLTLNLKSNDMLHLELQSFVTNGSPINHVTFCVTLLHENVQV